MKGMDKKGEYMKLAEKIGFIGGGKMAEALIKGILDVELVNADQIMVADPDLSRRDLLKKSFSVAVSADGNDIVKKSEVVILAVKPQVMGKLLDQLNKSIGKEHLIISIAAGIPISFIEGSLAGSGCRVVRVMPNTPALIQQGASALSPGSRVKDNDLEIARSIFDAIGISLVLDEVYLDAVTGLSGSGPAYVFTFIESLIDAGLKVGLSRQVAMDLVLQTISGSVNLIRESGEDPALLRAMVTSPGGTTIAGLHEFEKAGFRGIVMNAVEAATLRSRELGACLSQK